MENESKRRRTKLQAAILACLLGAAVCLAVSVGSANLSVWDSIKIILSRSPLSKLISTDGVGAVYDTIIWKVRLPRVLLSGLVGASLALAGTTFQSLFQNPLADPHILGVSSGASLGATAAMIFGAASMNFLGIGMIGVCAFIGAVFTTFLVYGIARTGNRASAVYIVLAGTAVSAVLSAIVNIIMIFNHNQIEKVYLWTLGSFSGANWVKAGFMCVAVLLCGAGLFVCARDLDALTTGEETAASLGVDTDKTKKILILLASLLVAACVSVSGIIGFVGLIIPHILRLLTGSAHRKLLPFSALGGASFMIFCDACARTIAAPSEIPVGAITAFIGGPFFIYLIYRNKKKVF